MTPVQRKPGRPRTGSVRIEYRSSAGAARWLADRDERMPATGASVSTQAAAEMDLWRAVLAAELDRIRLTVPHACCIADVCAGWMLDAAIGITPGLVYGECAEAFRIARDVAPGLQPDISSYGAKWAPEETDPARWEQDLLGYLATLGPAADHALRDAISRWWKLGLEPTVEGFAAAGLRVTG